MTLRNVSNSCENVDTSCVAAEATSGGRCIEGFYCCWLLYIDLIQDCVTLPRTWSTECLLSCVHGVWRFTSSPWCARACKHARHCCVSITTTQARCFWGSTNWRQRRAQVDRFRHNFFFFFCDELMHMFYSWRIDSHHTEGVAILNVAGYRKIADQLESSRRTHFNSLIPNEIFPV